MSTKINRLDDSSSFYLAGFQPRTLDSKNRVITVIRNVQQVANIIPFVNLQPSGGRLDDLNITADVASTLIIEEELWKAQVEILYDRGLPVHLAEKIVSYLSDPSKVRYTRRERSQSDP